MADFKNNFSERFDDMLAFIIQKAGVSLNRDF